MEGQRVLIVEDCYLMADTLQDILTAAGATVVGAANSVGTALRMIEALQHPKLTSRQAISIWRGRHNERLWAKGDFGTHRSDYPPSW